MELRLRKDYVSFIKDYGPYHPLLYHTINEQEKIIRNFFEVYLVDRTKTFIGSKEYKIVSPVPSMQKTEDFNTLIAARADYIRTITKDRTVVLMWSGGLDSTCAFYALVAAGVPFHMHINHHAIGEHPKLAAEILAGQFPLVTAEYVYTGFLGMPHDKDFEFRKFIEDTPNLLVITGEIGDQLFGSVKGYCRSFETRQKPYEYVVPGEVQEILDPTVLTFLNKPKASITYAEWVWAINFTCKYQDVLLRMGMLWRLLPVPPLSNVLHFYDDENLQRWAMNHYEENAMYEQATYKLAIRNYLRTQGCDENYCATKIKDGSLCRLTYR
jgi:hypothetical protein